MQIFVNTPDLCIFLKKMDFRYECTTHTVYFMFMFFFFQTFRPFKQNAKNIIQQEQNNSVIIKPRKDVDKILNIFAMNIKNRIIRLIQNQNLFIIPLQHRFIHLRLLQLIPLQLQHIPHQCQFIHQQCHHQCYRQYGSLNMVRNYTGENGNRTHLNRTHGLRRIHGLHQTHGLNIRELINRSNIQVRSKFIKNCRA